MSRQVPRPRGRPPGVEARNGKPPTELGTRLLAWRKKHRLSRARAADEIGVSHPSIYAWEILGVEPNQRIIRRYLVQKGLLPKDALERLKNNQRRKVSKPNRARKARPNKGGG